MKTKLTKLAASAITLALLSSSAIAQDEEKKGKKKGKPTAERPESAKPKDPRAQRSPEEALKAIKARLAENEKFAEMFTKRADSDGDGKVSDEEIKAAIAKMGERRKRGEGDRPKGKRPEGDRPKGKR
ncbi:MAG TPA: hypothetical protein EYG40_07830, partial [Verrucomicrobia bacterium]|nr:hypothetical protein [Verrucomicrobiota bacterium]